MNDEKIINAAINVLTDGGVVLYPTDTVYGLGANIFDKYVCGECLQSTSNVGLGLYFCKKIVNAHDGEILLVPNGTNNEFVIKLPITDEHSAFISEVIL